MKQTVTGNSSNMPNLDKKDATFLMDCIYYWLPCFHLFSCPNAGSVCIPYPNQISINKHKSYQKL